jgi:hypothetical protein
MMRTLFLLIVLALAALGNSGCASNHGSMQPSHSGY